MTPEEEARLLDSVALMIEAEMSAAFARYRELVLGGMAPRDAVITVMESFKGEFAEQLASAFTAILSTTVGAAAVLEMKIGDVTLSSRLYANASELATIVQGIVDRHVAGFTDARSLALSLYEGYGFRPVEVLTFSRTNTLLPRYLREALLPDLSGDFDTIFARLQVAGLTTPALRAAYTAVLGGIEDLKKGKGQELLDKKLRVAFEEKARYLANRIAQTELHRAYAERQAKELMDDERVRFVQWRLSPYHPRADICDYFAEVDLYGVGAGIYPKEVAPVPVAHPFCGCVLAPRFTVRGKPRYNETAARGYFASKDQREAARIAGSAAKLDAILGGSDPLDVHNAGKPEAYEMKSVAEAAEEYASRLP